MSAVSYEEIRRRFLIKFPEIFEKFSDNQENLSSVFEEFSDLEVNSLTLPEVLEEMMDDPRWYLDGTGEFLYPLVYQVWVDLEGVKDRKDNILNLIDGDWKSQYQIALARAVFQMGSFVSIKDDFYGWMDYELGERLKRTVPSPEVIAFLNLREVQWMEFESTFEGNKSHHGVSVDAVMSDGTSAEIRYSGGIGRLLNAILD